MQRIMYCVLGMCCATVSHAGLIRTDAHARVLDEQIIISSRVVANATPIPTPEIPVTPQTLAAGTLFDTNSARLRGTASLQPLIQALETAPATRVTVTGHTDNTGSPRYNQTLSLSRAQAVMHVLRNAAPQHRYLIRGEGERHPAVSNLTPGGRAQNRRVVVEVTP